MADPFSQPGQPQGQPPPWTSSQREKAFRLDSVWEHPGKDFYWPISVESHDIYGPIIAGFGGFLYEEYGSRSPGSHSVFVGARWGVRGGNKAGDGEKLACDLHSPGSPRALHPHLLLLAPLETGLGEGEGWEVTILKVLTSCHNPGLPHVPKLLLP